MKELLNSLLVWQVWVAKRSMSKATYPGLLDQVPARAREGVEADWGEGEQAREGGESESEREGERACERGGRRRERVSDFVSLGCRWLREGSPRG